MCKRALRCTTQFIRRKIYSSGMFACISNTENKTRKNIKCAYVQNTKGKQSPAGLDLDWGIMIHCARGWAVPAVSLFCLFILTEQVSSAFCKVSKRIIVDVGTWTLRVWVCGWGNYLCRVVAAASNTVKIQHKILPLFSKCLSLSVHNILFCLKQRKVLISQILDQSWKRLRFWTIKITTFSNR